MNIRLDNADLILILALALGGALLLAARFRPKTWRGLLLDAMLANLAAIAAVVAVEALLA
jgi:Tfp pilus assembly protein PilN